MLDRRVQTSAKVTFSVNENKVLEVCIGIHISAALPYQ